MWRLLGQEPKPLFSTCLRDRVETYEKLCHLQARETFLFYEICIFKVRSRIALVRVALMYMSAAEQPVIKNAIANSSFGEKTCYA